VGKGAQSGVDKNAEALENMNKGKCSDYW
jgi:hypothetical protein